METLFPYLEVSGPDGQQFRVELAKDRLTIGRFDVFNDVALEPDPQQLVSRRIHCMLEQTMGGWWVAHNGGINPTFVRRNDEDEMKVVEGRVLLRDGDSIRILGKLTEAGEKLYWKLTFHDPFGTQDAGQAPSLACLEYNWVQAKLYRLDGLERQEIRHLRPQEHKLIRYMDQRNRANSYEAVFCTFEELMMAVWGDETHTEAELNRLIWELRQKLEPNPREPRFVETVRGMGYRLVTRPVRK